MKKSKTIGSQKSFNESNTNYSKYRFLLSIFFVCFALPILSLALEDNQNLPATLSIALADEVNLGMKYTTLFKVQNNNYVSGNPPLQITVFYTLEKNNVLISEGNFSKSVNSFTSANTGSVQFYEPGTYTLCGWSEISNTICKDIIAIDPDSISCDVSISLSAISENFTSGNKINLENELDFHEGQKIPFIIEYWVEDSKGIEVKRRSTTSNLDVKSFTPHVETGSEVFIAKNKLVYIACDNSNNNVESEFSFEVFSANIDGEVIPVEDNESIIIDFNKSETESNLSTSIPVEAANQTILNESDDKPQLNITESDDISEPINYTIECINTNFTNNTHEIQNSSEIILNHTSDNATIIVNENISQNNESNFVEEKTRGKILSFYTRSKKYNESINLYANINTAVGGMFVIEGADDEKHIQVQASDKNQRFTINLRARTGLNNFTAKLLENDTISDNKSLVINLSGLPEVNKNITSQHNHSTKSNTTIKKNISEKNNVCNCQLNKSSTINQIANKTKINLNSTNSEVVKVQSAKNTTIWKSNSVSANATIKPQSTMYQSIKDKSKKYSVALCAVAVGIAGSVLVGKKGQ